MAKVVTRTTAQIAQELSQVHKLTQVYGEPEQTQLQLDIMNNAHTARSPSQTYADTARIIPISITTPIPSTVPSVTPKPVFYTADTSKGARGSYRRYYTSSASQNH
ncbi:hypothetical protein NCS52_01532400 [Fusarium sp. LHS14.1]|nr:hypothetical protein NCS52_01532400 [Fusarium sp. LHS14.1]